jgi:polyphosphate glucokinase
MEPARMKVLVIDVGGTNVKVGGTGRGAPIKIPSGPDMTASQMATAVKAAVTWSYDAVAIGYPGAVVGGRPVAEPANLGGGWVRFDFADAFGKPVRVINDAAMQALGSYEGGHMLFLGLGTGLGSALVADGVLAPLELAHLPYRKRRTFEDYLGLRGLERLGRKRWQRHVEAVVALLRHAMQVDYVVLGGGQTKKLKGLAAEVRLGSNDNAMLGGVRLWVPAKAGEGDPRRHILRAT